MSQIRTSSLSLGLLLSLFVFSLAGCGDKSSQADLSPTTGKHSATWLPSGHATAAETNLESCTECHGSDFTGGISRVTCTPCHMESAEAPHPSFWNYTSQNKTAWGKYAYALHGRSVTQSNSKPNDTTACANAVCHGIDLSGVAGSGPSCSTKCHMGDTLKVHPANWRILLTQPGNPPHAQAATILPDHGNYVNTNGTESCRNAVCHGNQGQGVFLSGPACVMCHF